MQRKYFTEIDTNSKTELTWNYGELITSIETVDYYITLFLLDNFFVEIFIDKKNKELVNINIQDDDDVLYAYIQDLSLQQLISLNK
jgi:hypothetical protein